MSIEVQRSRWSRPLVGIAAVAVVGAGLGAFLGIRAVTGAGSATGSGPTGQPPGRTDAAIAYDAANHSVVLFGGQGKSSTLHDTWIWNGSAWSQAHPATSPPALGNAQMTYDPVTGDVLLVGSEEAAVSNGGPIACSAGSGSSSSGSTGSTTIFVPPAIAVPDIAPAPTATGKAGEGSTTTPPDCATVIAPGAATWLWNGSDWSKATGTTPFAVFESGALATDPVSGRVVLLPRGPFAEPDGIAEPAIACPMQAPGSDVQPSCPMPGLTTTPWTWNGHQWQKMATSIDLGALKTFTSAIVDDAVTGKLAAFDPNDAQPVPSAVPCVARGGALLPSADATGHESVWSGTSWRQVAAYNDGPVMPSVAFVGDPATHSDVALSGNGQTWIWTGSWACVHPGTTPTIVSGAASVYDAATAQVLIFGGAGSASHQTGLFDQTWTWDGSNWTQRGGSAGPSVLVPVPSPVSIPPGLPCNPIAQPAKPVGAPVVQPAEICKGITPGSPGSGAGGSGSTGGGSGVARSYPGG